MSSNAIGFNLIESWVNQILYFYLAPAVMQGVVSCRESILKLPPHIIVIVIHVSLLTSLIDSYVLQEDIGAGPVGFWFDRKEKI